MTDWVFEGKGVATRKYDGIAIKIENGKVFRRYEWRQGEQVPANFTRLQDPDPKRPHAAIPGWVCVPDSFLVSPHGTEEKALREAWRALIEDTVTSRPTQKVQPVHLYAPTQVRSFTPIIPDGTYEFCGPKIRGNHEGFETHVLLRHGADVIKNVPRTFEKLKTFLETFEGEGIVWHYKMSDKVTLMAKIKRRDFGFMERITKEDAAMMKELRAREEDTQPNPYNEIDNVEDMPKAALEVEV